ncbi:MAG: helix-turn-helix domain-containing protein [Deltaproteobacteria bacterium]
MLTEKDIPDAAALQRGSDILERIKAVFAEKGFDGASMQDLARAAGMSAGNFYRYFPSKDAIISAMTCKDMDMIRCEFTDILASDDPMKAFRQALDAHIEQGEKDGALWVQIEAAAARRPEIAKQMAETEQMIVDHMLAVFAHLSGQTLAHMTLHFTAHVRLIIMLVQSLSTRHTCGFRQAEPDPAVGQLVIRTIENTVKEILGQEPGDAPNRPHSGKAE